MSTDYEQSLARLRAECDELSDVLRRNGFVMCDIPACNCGSWHHRYGLQERMHELRDALAEAGHPLCNENGNLISDALRALIEERDALKGELDLRRKSGSAVDRLHNLCEGIAAEADGSEWSREEWERIDAENAALRKERDALLAEVAPLRGKPGELPRYVTQCFGCEGFPSGANDPCDVCGRSAMKPRGSE